MWALPNRKAKQIFAGLQHDTGAGQRYLARRRGYFLATVQVSNGSPVRRRSPPALVYMSSGHGLIARSNEKKEKNERTRTYNVAVAGTNIVRSHGRSIFKPHKLRKGYRQNKL
jgi:hypothetical protein